MPSTAKGTALRGAPRQQRLHAGTARRDFGVRHDLRHDPRQPRLGGRALSRPVLIGDTAARRHHRDIQAREPVAPGLRHRRVRASRLQPARRGGGLLPPHGAHVEKARRVSRQRLAALMAVRARGQRAQAGQGARHRRRCADPRPRGFGRSAAAARRARRGCASCCARAAPGQAAVGADQLRRRDPSGALTSRRCSLPMQPAHAGRHRAAQGVRAGADCGAGGIARAARGSARPHAPGDTRLLVIATETPPGLLALPQYPQRARLDSGAARARCRD